MAKQNDTFASVLAYAETEQGNIDGKVSAVATRLFTLAVQSKEMEQFLEGCEKAQDDRRDEIQKRCIEKSIPKAERKKLVNLPRCWTQAKSNIRSMWEKGFHPSEFDSYHKLREKKAELSKGTRGSKKAASTESNTPDLVTQMQQPVSNVLFGELLKRIEQMPTDTQIAIAAQLSDIVEGYESKVTQADMNALEDAQIEETHAVNE